MLVQTQEVGQSWEHAWKIFDNATDPQSMPEERKKEREIEIVLLLHRLPTFLVFVPRTFQVTAGAINVDLKKKMQLITAFID